MRADVMERGWSCLRSEDGHVSCHVLGERMVMSEERGWSCLRREDGHV